jgi:hypothetical protein
MKGEPLGGNRRASVENRLLAQENEVIDDC